MNTFIKFIICTLIIISCKDLSKFEEILISDSSIWNFMALEDGKWTYIGSQRKFLKDKTYEYYLSSDPAKQGNNINDAQLDKINNRNEWSFNRKNNILSFESKELSYKVIRYNQDSIFLDGNGYSGKFLMVKLRQPDSR